MQKYIFILVLAFAIVRLELHSQGYSPSPNYIGGSWGFLYDRCNCDTPFRWEISYKDFPYMGANSLAAAIGDLHGHSIYTFRESNFLNPYSSAILPKQQIESLVIRSPQHSGLIKIIPNAENKNKEYIVYTADYDDYDDYLSISKKDTSYMKDIDGYQALYSAQAPAVLSEYLIFSIGGFDPSKNAVKLLGMPFSIEYTESYGDTLQIRKKAKIKYLPKPYLKLYKLKHIDRFTPSLGKAIKNQINSQEKKISLEQILAANENNVILTNILDSLGRIKKQIYTPNKGDISENITLIHSYGIDTDTVRQYLNIPYRYAEAGTYLLMTVIYQNEKLISLHQDLLAQKIEEQYHKMLRKPRKDRPYYPVLPKNDLTSRVFYNAAGDIEKIITPSAPEINVIFLYDYSFAYPYNICTLEFKYSDYDAQGNWQTLTIYGAKGKWQRANCSEELVVKRQIIYKAE